MIRNYIRERYSWIGLFFVLQALFIFVAFLDTAIPFTPMLYINFISTLVFLLFVAIRYHKETLFYKKLEEWNHSLHLTNLENPETPFEKIVIKSLTEQANVLKNAASENQLTLEQEKDDLMAWIHEVKTPLTAMHLIIERIEDTTFKAPLKYEWLRIHLLLDQQLHQKRMTFIENDLYIEKTDLETILYQEIKILQSWCIQKGIGFDIHLETAHVLSDAKWLAFILRQLLTNAVKFSEGSDININSFQKNEQSILHIQDFGRGIDSKDLPRIFDKGFTSTANHLDTMSTGMGLYLAKKAATPLLIKIDVQSKINEGTTFTLTFPRRNDLVSITGV